MKVVPSVVPPDTSSAEKRVFEDLTGVSTGKGSVCFHSLRLSRHEYKREGELDFVLLSPFGLMIIEVKGGGISRDSDGLWTYTDRYDQNHHSSEGPFQQARSGMYSLVKELKRLCGKNEFGDVAYGFGVIFPDCDFRDLETVEWDSSIVLDASSYRSAGDLDSFLSGLINYWRDRTGTPSNQSIDGSLMYRLKKHLRPKFDRVPSIQNRADDLVRKMEDLTEDQYLLLDQLSNKRILCSGGAGTGKTFLAAELAQRHADQGDSVLFTCRNKSIVSYLRPRIEESKVDVLSFGSLKDSDRAWDVLIVDEGQDLLTFDCLEILDGVVKGGLEEGNWRLFYDANNQAGIYEEYDPDAVKLLNSFGVANVSLDRNCRNTHEIVIQIKLLTLADLGTPSAGHGPSVQYREFEDSSEAVVELEDHLRSLIDDEVRTEHITILSPLSFSDSIASSLDPSLRNRITSIDPGEYDTFPPDTISFSTIKNFKGLENQFIVVVDIQEIGKSPEAMSPVYVAMSRARVSLCVILPKPTIEEIRSRTVENLEKLDEDLEVQ